LKRQLRRKFTPLARVYPRALAVPRAYCTLPTAGADLRHDGPIDINNHAIFNESYRSVPVALKLLQLLPLTSKSL
jgi:hypothetical protein